MAVLILLRTLSLPVKIFLMSHAVMASSIFFSPQKAKDIDFRANLKTIQITLDKASPAYGAFEDVQWDLKQQKIAEARQARPVEWATTPSLKTQPSQKLQYNNLSGVHEIATAVIRVAPIKISPTADIDAELQAAYIKHQKFESAIAKAEALVKQELLRRQNVLAEKKIQTPSGSTITIASHSLVSPDRQKLNEIRQPSSLTETKTDSANHKSNEFGFAGASLGGAEGQESPQGLFHLRGSFEFINGFVFVPDNDEIYIYHLVNNRKDSYGYIHIESGEYVLPIYKPEGVIVAEIRRSDGALVGRAEAPLIELVRENLNTENSVYLGERRATRSLQVSLLPQAIEGEVVLATITNQKAQILSEAKVHIVDLQRYLPRSHKNKKQFLDSSFRLGSRGLIKATQRGAWPTLSQYESGSFFRLSLLTESNILSLLSLATKDKFNARDAEEQAIIIGQLTIGGRPVAGATVQLLDEQKQPDTITKPVYFSGPLPDQKLLATTSNGLFVFTGVRRAVNFVQAVIDQQKQLPVLAFTERKTVTQIHLDVEKEKRLELSAYSDKSKDNFVPFQARFSGGEQFVTQVLPESQKIQLMMPKGLAYIDFEADIESAITRIMTNGYEGRISAPIFQREQIFAEGSLANVIGEIHGDDYSIAMGSSAEKSFVQVQYLNQKGEPTGELEGQDGQRFRILGLPTGYHTILIIPKKSKDILTEIIYVDADAITWLNKNLID